MRAHDRLRAQLCVCALVSLLASWLAGCTFDRQGLASDDLRAGDGPASEARLDDAGPPDQRCAEPVAPDGSAADQPPPVDLKPPAPDVGCSSEVCDDHDNDCDGLIDEGFSTDCQEITCEGAGKLKTISNSCINDFGSSQSGDALEIYCCAGVARFCLSGEACPWRNSCGNSTAATCSRSGLSSTDGHMATVASRTDCTRQAFNGHLEYYCDASDRIHF